MPKKRKQYPAEYRWQIVDLVRSGRSPEAVAREFEPSALTIRNWVKQADITYVCTGAGWMYVAAVVDPWSRLVVGWAMRPTYAPNSPSRPWLWRLSTGGRRP